jgi:hypothetical protein
MVWPLAMVPMKRIYEVHIKEDDSMDSGEGSTSPNERNHPEHRFRALTIHPPRRRRLPVTVLRHRLWKPAQNEEWIMRRALTRTGKIIVGGAGAAVLAGLVFVGGRWARYGKATDRGPSDPILDHFMPTYEVREVHETRVAAPADVTFAVAEQLDLQQSPLVRAIFRGREVLMGASAGTQRQPQSFLSEIFALGWGMLQQQPHRYLAIGAVTQPWVANVQCRELPPEEFAAFQEPGYAKIIVSVVAEPIGPAESLFRTETRVMTTDAESRRRFRRYWSFVSPGVLLIRREMLRLVRQEAERRMQARTHR